MSDGIHVEQAKRVTTYDHEGRANGWLVELYKDGAKTTAYLTAASAGAFKGYHLHRVRAARYVCIRGRMRIILYARAASGGWARQEHLLDASEPSRLFIPAGVATGLRNIGDEEAWLINYPDPAYDPALKDEQVEYSEDELESGVVK
ncbi:MAG: WxcM-like domain-containing protein [Chloroflexi bacterium]|nr:WxcM-like domain-containing protein [Chloroflexota bacterium]